MGTLYYGDNLDVLKRYIADASVDLVYLDPPFNSAQNYNAFFQEKDGTAAASQIKAFEDTWEWNMESEAAYNSLTEQPGKVSEVMQAFRTFLGSNDMMAYLAMMAPRLVELRRVMKETASLYLHCDPTASHYLKLLLDGVFGIKSFRNEIIWKRTSSHGNVSRAYGDVTDSIFWYTVTGGTGGHAWNQPYAAYSEKHIREKFTGVDPDGRVFTTSDLRNPGVRPNLTYDYKGYKPHQNGWAISREKMEEYDRQGRLYFPENKTGRIRLKRYLDESPGERMQTLWTDIAPINSQAAERLGYPTQKPVALLERIVAASSNPGDLVLDPFCGCGTTVDAAEKLGRKWIGIDITSLSTALIKSRLRDTYGGAIEINTVGEPRSVADAEKLAAEDKYQFQWWALGLVGARPLEEKKGADKGIDGKILFRESPKDPKPQQVIFSVKGGGTSVKDIRDLRGVIERDQAAIGVLLTMQDATKPMKQEAAEAGFFSSAVWHKQYPRLQIYTVAELLAGRQVERPPTRALDETYKRAPKAKPKAHEQQGLGL